jgi:pSer/pThr/pTyr-binding forkhead associated (FHA) protein
MQTVRELAHDTTDAIAVLRDATGRAYPLTGTSNTIGRSSDNDIVLPDVTVSRHHAVIEKTAATFVITDSGSANGVHVLGERIRNSATLDDGYLIRIGSYEFTFEV